MSIPTSPLSCASSVCPSGGAPSSSNPIVKKAGLEFLRRFLPEFSTSKFNWCEIISAFTILQKEKSILAKIVKSVMQSAAEAECGGLYMNAKEAVPMGITLEESNHPQPATPIRADNSTADGIMNKTVKQKQSKSMDMRFYWLQDRVEQGQFRIFWAPGNINLAEYQSKAQPASVHQAV
jgi:hypothetical protein